ncbi:MAG: hypothetical protein O2967_21150 [Proteobacteria bacterium]|nr:hypothetical protein [Pseudomonadota bacterium]
MKSQTLTDPLGLSRPRTCPLARRSIGPGLLLLAAVALPQCAPSPFKSPVIPGGSDNTVSIEAGKFVDPYDFAEKYCAARGKHAVKIGATVLSDHDITLLYGYDCVSEHG